MEDVGRGREEEEEDEDDGRRRDEDEPAEERAPRFRVIATFWGILGTRRHEPATHTRLRARLSMMDVYGRG